MLVPEIRWTLPAKPAVFIRTHLSKICTKITSHVFQDVTYRGTSLLRNCFPLGPYSRPIPKVLWWSWGGGAFLMREVTLYVY